MARRPHPIARLVLATTVLGAAFAAAPLAAGAQAPATAPTLAEVLLGAVDGVTAEATTSESPAGAMGVTVEVTNDGDEPVAVAIPFGTLLVTEDEGDQTLTVTPPPTDEVVEVAAAGGTPTVEFEPGTSSQELPAYCTEMDDGYPFEPVPVSPIDDAHPVLAETLRTATAEEADDVTTQDAVWWLTDEPQVPVADHLTGLLAVDTEAFAATPHRVTPDTGYVPLWMRDEVPPGGAEAPSPYDEEEAAAILDESFEGPGAPSSDDGGGGVGIGVALWAILVGVVVITAVVVASRAGRGTPAAAPVLARTTPGWYPDPWGGGGHRYWDGQRWTTRTMGSRPR